MRYLPLCLDLQSKPVLIVGGGSVAERKAGLLVRAGARVTVLAPTIRDTLKASVESLEGQCTVAAFTPGALDAAPYRLVVAATSDRTLNAWVAEAARERHIPVNAVDMPELCDFIFPALVDRDPMVIGVTSSGQAPVLTRRVRAQLEALLPSSLGRLARVIGRGRDTLHERLPPAERRHFWERVLDDLTRVVDSGEEARAQAWLEQAADSHAPTVGEVFLIGAGPGDPDLMTFKALRLLQRADVVLYDRLVSPAILDMARRDAERVYVGKARRQHTMRQAEINRSLVTLAREGKVVARLKGGDPFIFGRGGEEIEGLMSEGIPFQVVPGITAATGCASYAGIPLTHRDHASSVRFLAGNLKDGRLPLDGRDCLNPGETLVIYMGINNLPIIIKELVKAGRDPKTPVAVVHQGTEPAQTVVLGTLGSIDERVQTQDLPAPTLIIIGAVVSLSRRFAWYRTENGYVGDV